MNKHTLFGVAGIALVLAVLLVWYFAVGGNGMGDLPIIGDTFGNKEVVDITPPEPSFGGDVYQEASVADPVSEMPDTNPFEKTVNPYTDAYQNPF